MKGTPTLVCVGGSNQGHHAEVSSQGVRIGRDPSCEIHIQDPDVSRSHARVILHNSAVWVQDAGSRNGVFVNGKRVVDNKSIGPGDKLNIGPHVFVLELLEDQDADPSVSVRLDSLQEPQKKWKIWPFVLIALVLGGLIAAISLASGPSAVSQQDAEPGRFSLTAVMKPQEQEDGAPLTQALASASADERKDWPDPPPGAGLTELVEAGHAHYQAGRLREALAQYQMALKLDGDCEICEVRIKRVNTELEVAVKESFDVGLRYYNSLKYREAINAWETVLLLEPNTQAPIHKQTLEYLAQAKEKRDKQF